MRNVCETSLVSQRLAKTFGSNESSRVLRFVGLVALISLNSSCIFRSSTSAVVTGCDLPEDQSSTISGRWRVVPVPIAVRAEDFEADEIQALKEAADVWNNFYGRSLSLSVLNYGGSTVQTSNSNKPSSLCTTGLVQGSQFLGEVVIYKQGRWPYSNRSAIALTSFCPIPANPIPTIFMAIMELNYEDFFVAGKKQPDLKSIFIHELGHLLGLDHSCEVNSNRAGMPNCRALTAAQSDYYDAVMFPVVRFNASTGAGEVRQTLNKNDMSRANCLYGADGAGTPTRTN
jgi:hypothetical protein